MEPRVPGHKTRWFKDPIVSKHVFVVGKGRSVLFLLSHDIPFTISGGGLWELQKNVSDEN